MTAVDLVCVGDHDTWSTAAVTRELASCLHEARVVVLDGAGHLPNLEQPSRFNQHLLSFLSHAKIEAGHARDLSDVSEPARRRGRGAGR